MRDAYICDAVRTPIGRYAGTLAAVRTDAPLGTLVAPVNCTVPAGRIDIDRFAGFPMAVEDGKVIWEGRPLRACGHEVTADIADGAKVK